MPTKHLRGASVNTEVIGQGNHWKDWLLISGLGFTATAVIVCYAWIVGAVVFFAMTVVALVALGFVFIFGIIRYVRTRSTLQRLRQIEKKKNEQSLASLKS